MDHYFPSSLRIKKEKEYLNLKQTEGMLVAENAHKFNSLGKFLLKVMGSEHLKIVRFGKGFLGRVQASL